VVDGADLDVSFDLEVDDAPGLGYDTIQRGYRTDGAVRTTIVDDLSALTAIGGGSYTFTIIGGAAQAAIDNRYLFRVAAGEERATRVYFYGDFPASPVETLEISAAACNNCHGPEGIHVHGGYFAAEEGGEPCLTCHGVEAPDRTTGELELVPRLLAVAHEYHSGLRDHITYPTYMTNCSVCHSDADELVAANAMDVSGANCFTCHGSMDSWDFPVELSFHITNIPDPDTHDCQTACHTDGGLASEKIVVADFHNGHETERHGFIYDGVDTSIVEGAKFDWAITGMADDGTDLTITWQATYDGNAVDPCNDTVGAGAPTFHLGEGGLRTYRSYAQGDDFIIGNSTSAPGQPDPRVDLDATNTTCASMIATTVIPAEAATAEKGRIALGGKPLVESADVAGLIVEARVPSPTYDWQIGDGAPMERRAIVDTNLCLNCHVGSLYQHGGDRVDNVDYCMVCHNSAANEQSVRAGMGVDWSEAYDGQVGETFELKTMVHRIHSAGEDDSAPYVIYRGRGIYGFAPDVSLLPNWDAGGTAGCSAEEIARGERDAYGSDPTSSTSCQPHNFHTPTYPRSLNECTACHVEGSVDFQPDQTKAMANTIEAGSELEWDNQIDDVLQGATTTACITCHSGGPAKGHAYQNSWEPQEFEEGRKTIIDAVN
jgi:OmcA/MtrC family decaheme c-type cytochrome